MRCADGLRRLTVLAIDPGPEKSAYVLWDGTRVLSHGIVVNREIAYRFDFDSGFGRPSRLAIEMIASYGMAVGREVFETCVWIGRFAEAWGGDDAILIPRLDIKVHLCKSARAKDANVRQALIDRFGTPGTKARPGVLHGISTHCWAALAVAVCAFDRLKCGYTG